MEKYAHQESFVASILTALVSLKKVHAKEATTVTNGVLLQKQQGVLPVSYAQTKIIQIQLLQAIFAHLENIAQKDQL